MYNKELLEKLAQRTYVFMFTVMEMDEFSTMLEDGVPVKLTAEELTWFADASKKGLFDGTEGMSKLPKSVLKKLDEGIKRLDVKDQMEEEECTDYGISFMSLPVDLDLAIQELCTQSE